MTFYFAPMKCARIEFIAFFLTMPFEIVAIAFLRSIATIAFLLALFCARRTFGGFVTRHTAIVTAAQQFFITLKQKN